MNGLITVKPTTGNNSVSLEELKLTGSLSERCSTCNNHRYEFHSIFDEIKRDHNIIKKLCFPVLHVYF